MAEPKDGLAQDQRLLRRTFTLARFARNQGNEPYAALCARDGGSVAAEGENTQNDPKSDLTGHAEINAIRNACQSFSRETVAGFTVVASCEPCPMCAAAIAMTGIRRLVFGASAARVAELRPGTNAVSCRQVFELIGCDIEVVGPMLEDEALAVLS